MEVKSSQNSVTKSKPYQIPIEEYEKDMDTELAKEKKKEILNLFMNCNNLSSVDEYGEIAENLHYACRDGDVELIKIYLNERIKNDTKDFTFKIDKTKKTASLLRINKYFDQVIIPRTVKIESTEYLITSVIGTCEGIGSLKFSEDSAVKTIYINAFSNSAFDEIYFPSSLRELKEGWCNSTYNLNKIIISPSNGQFKFIDDKYLIGKSDTEKDEFDILLFARRDIKEISIPSNIKTISSYAFQECKYLYKVEIPTNSNLQTIGIDAFSQSKIEKIYFPSSLRELKEGWCFFTSELNKIIISPSNGQFKFIDDKYLLGKSDTEKDEFDILLFARRDIKEISIPSNIKIISSYSFNKCEKLNKVEIPTNSNLQTIESHAFSFSKIKEIFIPSKVSAICKNAFYHCENLDKVEIPTNSNLQTIESQAFAFSKIKEIFIPSKVSTICELTFDYCENLDKVEIPTNSNLQTIESDAFANSSIKEIFIPSKVTTIHESAFHFCQNLDKVEIPTNSNLQTIESDAFTSSKIKEIYFPSSLRELKEGWCSYTYNLNKIIISPSNGQFKFVDDKYLLGKSDTEKDEFDILLFARRDIKEISIPSNIKIISSYAFCQCENLDKIEIPTNSNLQTIESDAFVNSTIKEIFIPSKVSKIYNNAFNYCPNLNKVEIPTNSNLQKIESYVFAYTNINEIFIPSKVSTICKNAFYYCENLNNVEIPTNSNLQTIGSDAFTYSRIKGIFIPSKVSTICEDAFHSCQNLQIIEISEESELESFPFSAFSECSDFIIMIPSSLDFGKA